MPGNGYLFVYETLLAKIKQRVLTPGMQLDSEVELARQLSVSRMTVRKALVRLEEEGHIFRRSGIGTFVKAPTPLEAAGRRLEIGIEASLEGNPRPFSLKILAEAQQACARCNCNLRLLSLEELLAGERIDAAFFASLEPEYFPQAVQLARRIPTLLLNRITDLPELSYVAVDYAEATRRIVRRMLGDGDRTVLFVGSAAANFGYAPRMRELGYRQAHDELGVRINEELILPGDVDLCRQLAERMIRLRPDFLFVCYEYLVTYVYAAVESALPRLEKPVYLFCFDDIVDSFSLSSGAVSCGRMPFNDMCSRAIRYLSGRVRKEVPEGTIHEIFPMSYVITECPFLI